MADGAPEQPTEKRTSSSAPDKAVRHAWIALLAYLALRALAAMIGAMQQPEIATWFVGDLAFAVIVLGLLAWGIYNQIRTAALAAIVYIVAMQLYTWFVLGSPAGTIISVIVTAFLLRGAKAMSARQREQHEGGTGASA